MSPRTVLALGLAALLIPFPAELAGQTRGVEGPRDPALAGLLPRTAIQRNTPESQVAALVREAMRAPERTEVWDCLQDALKEMNAPAGAHQGPNSQDQRASGSLVCAGGSTDPVTSSSATLTTQPGGPQRALFLQVSLDGAWPWVNGAWQWWTEVSVREPWLEWALLVALGLASLWLGRRSALHHGTGRPSTKQNPSSWRGGGPGRPALVESPPLTAITLWEGGVPAPEIARRTGLAQDALTVLLALEERGGGNGDPDPSRTPPPFRSNPRSTPGRR